MGRKPTPASFKPGDPRASAAGRKSKRKPGIKPPDLSEGRLMLEEFQSRAAEAMKVFDEALKDKDVGVAKTILNVCLPPSLVEKLADQAVAREIAELREQNQELLQRLAELEQPVRAAGGKV